jgi:hypothetical protein
VNAPRPPADRGQAAEDKRPALSDAKIGANRAQREAAALRDNLLRRKQQRQARQARAQDTTEG